MRQAGSAFLLAVACGLATPNASATELGDYSSAQLVALPVSVSGEYVTAHPGDIILAQDLAPRAIVTLDDDLYHVFNARRNKSVSVSRSTVLYSVLSSRSQVGYCAAIITTPRWCFWDFDNNGQFDIASLLNVPAEEPALGRYAPSPLLVGAYRGRIVDLPAGITFTVRTDIARPTMRVALMIDADWGVRFAVETPTGYLPYAERQAIRLSPDSSAKTVSIYGAQIEVGPVGQDGEVPVRALSGFPNDRTYAFFHCFPVHGTNSYGLIGSMITPGGDLNCAPNTIALVRDMSAHAF
jgi:hypothetical protein